jgi:hypothetical protein
MQSPTETIYSREMPGYTWEVETDARTVEVTLKDSEGSEIAMRRRLYVDELSGQEPLDPFDLAQRLMTEIQLEVRTNGRDRD